MKQPIMKLACLCPLFCCAGLACNGCRTSKATYPDSWSPAISVPAVACPRLAGRYANAGEVAPGPKTFPCGGSRGPHRGEWCGETALSQNIGDLASGDWVELRQPDADTLVVVSSDPTVAVKELHRKKGDFSCSRKGLERQLRASAVSLGGNARNTSAGQDIFNATATMINALTASGGVRTLTRRFIVAADGSLVMMVSQSETGTMVSIPYHVHDEAFVHWPSVTPPLRGAAP